MKPEPPSFQEEARLELILQRGDPAGIVLAETCLKLEAQIAKRIVNLPQEFALDKRSASLGVPHIFSRQMSWPVTMAGTMTLGLSLGLLVAMFTQTQTESYSTTQNYNIITVMAEPWQPLIQ